MGWYDGMDASFARKLQALIQASGGRVSVFSGYRSKEVQAELWADALAKYGSPDAARMWVAPPGKSNHGHGIAADLGYETDDAQAWVHANAGRFGLTFPMDWEPWHIEPMDARSGTPHEDDDLPMSGGAEAYTIPPEGYLGVDDPARRSDMGYQMETLMGFIMGNTYGGLGANDQSGLGAVDPHGDADPSGTTRKER